MLDETALVSFHLEDRGVSFLISAVLSMINALIVDMDGASGVMTRHKVSDDATCDGLDRRSLRSRRSRYILVHEQMIIVVGDANTLLRHRASRCHTRHGLLSFYDGVGIREYQVLRFLFAHLRRHHIYSTVRQGGAPLLTGHVAGFGGRLNCFEGVERREVVGAARSLLSSVAARLNRGPGVAAAYGAASSAHYLGLIRQCS